MTDAGPAAPPFERDVRRAADILFECYGAAAPEQARALEGFSAVPDFARAVSAEVRRRLSEEPAAEAPPSPQGG